MKFFDPSAQIYVIERRPYPAVVLADAAVRLGIRNGHATVTGHVRFGNTVTAHAVVYAGERIEHQIPAAFVFDPDEAPATVLPTRVRVAVAGGVDALGAA